MILMFVNARIGMMDSLFILVLMTFNHYGYLLTLTTENYVNT